MHGSRDEDSSRVGRLLADVQRDLDRAEPEDLAAEVAAGALIVDIRPAENRGSEGVLPGALVVDRTRAGVAARPDQPRPAAGGGRPGPAGGPGLQRGGTPRAWPRTRCA